jgi:hypothetical protein
MNPFRKNVLVLFGASLLIAMSVGSVLGAKPTGDTAGSRGQTISDFVHSVITGDQEVTVDETPTDEAPADESPADEAPADEDATDEDATDTEDSAPTDQTTDANAHGKCVAEIAQNPDEVGGPNENHGGAVSLAARETCRDEEATSESDTAADVQAEMTAREQAAADRAAAKEARKADKATAREARLAARAASVHGKSATHRGGHGH